MAEQTENLPRVWDGTAWVPVIIPGPPPDWADLREMARNAGWTPEGRLSWSTWSRRDDRGSDLSTGWALVQWTARSISLVGPGTGHRGMRSAVDLIDPTPDKVLAAARLVGLIGGAS